jgi:hypothetical protein
MELRLKIPVIFFSHPADFFYTIIRSPEAEAMYAGESTHYYC